MILNYLKTALRNIFRNKFYSLLNILGLSVGITVFLLIYFFIQYEFNFDKHFPRANQIYRITTDMIWENGDIQYTAMSPPPTAPALKKDYPEVLAATRFELDNIMLIEKQAQSDKSFEIKNYEPVFYIDSSFLDVFQLQIIQGSAESAFDFSNSIILSQSIAEKYFQDENPLGKMLRFNNSKNYVVKAVFEDVPKNSHYDFQILVNATDELNFQLDQWRKMNAYTYVVLDENTNPEAFEMKLSEFINTYMEPWKDLMEFRVQPLLDIHLRNTKEFDMANTSNQSILLVVFGISILILIIAAINYMNLSVAQSLARAKEVGLRKVVGGTKSMIVVQFLSESLMVTFFALFSGIVLAELIMPGFNDFVHTNIAPNYLKESWKILSFALVLGIVSGSYPAFYVSNFQPAYVLKGRSGNSVGGSWLKKILVIFQFSVSVILLIGTGVIYQQFSFIHNMDLGFKKDVMLNVYLWNDSTGVNSKQLKNNLTSVPGVKQIGLSDHVPGSEPWFEHFWPEGFESHMPLRTSNINPDYIPVLGLQLKNGRNFSNEYSLDTASCIINEAAVKHFGWTNEEAIGRTIKYNFSNSWEEMITARIIGVVNDYHYQSLHVNVEPIVLTMHKKYFPIVTAQLEGGNIQQTVNSIEDEYKKLNFAYPFEYEFLDTQVEEMYIVDQKVGQLLIWFSLLSVFIACLGLLGLSSYAVEKRTREIGVRKVFGASVKDVLSIFTKEFSGLVLIASIIAIPIGWFAMNQYLQQFAYRTTMGWWIFVSSALIALIIALATIGFQAYKYALRNPAEVLKYE